MGMSRTSIHEYWHPRVILFFHILILFCVSSGFIHICFSTMDAIGTSLGPHANSRSAGSAAASWNGIARPLTHLTMLSLRRRSWHTASVRRIRSIDFF